MGLGVRFRFCTAFAAVVALATPAGAAVTRPELTFDDAATQATLGAAYDLALTNLLDVNTVPYEASYNSTGFLTGGKFIRAGGGYEQPWTRDASINSWNAASLLEPEIAFNTLWAVVKKNADGLIVNQDNQLWDQVIWVSAAWNHYLVTGDKTFLKNAYEVTKNTLNLRKKAAFDDAQGLYRGQAFFNDGVAGYPVPPADAGETHGSAIVDYPNSDKVMVLSTNALYYQALRSAALMASALGKGVSDVTPWDGAASALKAKINQKFWIQDAGLYGYLINDGKLDDSEEGTGLSLAILFGIADATRAASVFEKAHVQPYGIVDVWPTFPRYTNDKPGRHNNIVWPMIQGFWGHAAARSGNRAAFAKELKTLAGLALGSNGFSETYHAQTGKVDGGWQTMTHWGSAPDQTWSATAYLRMVYSGLFGIDYTITSIAFAPTLPEGWGSVTLKGIAYRGMTLDVTLSGAGKMIESFKLDGASSTRPSIVATLTGAHRVEIVLGPAIPGPGKGGAGAGGREESAGAAGADVDVAGTSGIVGSAGESAGAPTATGSNGGAGGTAGSARSDSADDSSCSVSTPGGARHALVALLAVLGAIGARRRRRS